MIVKIILGAIIFFGAVTILGVTLGLGESDVDVEGLAAFTEERK